MSKRLRPPRPARLPVRVYNRIAGSLARAPARFSEEELLAEARKSTGLSDFGGQSFRDGLGVLLRAYDEEARLTPFGRRMLRHQLVTLLKARLTLTEAWQRDPKVRDSAIRRPLFILGLPRTGSSALHQLLGQDPGHQVLEYWLATAPGPRPDPSQWSSDPRFKRASRELRSAYRLDPELRALHDLSPEGPEECRHLLGQCFTDDSFDSNASIPSYTEWYAGCDMRPSYTWHRDVLRLVQSSGLERRWVLKYPAHLAHLARLFEAYPDACVVQLHRDPARVLPSLCSLVTRWRALYEDEVDVEAVARWQVEMWAGRIEQAMSVRGAHDDPSQFFDLSYEELRAEPIAAVRRLYDHFGFGLSEEAERRMRVWLSGHPAGRHGGHDYAAEDFGLDPGALSERFGAYRERYGVESEAASTR